MEQLTTQEINAISKKLYKEYTIIYEDILKLINKKYIHSEVYSRLECLFEIKKDLENQYRQLYQRFKEIRKEIEDVCPFTVYYDDSKENILNKIISIENNIPEIPSIDEIKNEIIIDSIDKEFNANKYIKNQISKFKQNIYYEVQKETRKS